MKTIMVILMVMILAGCSKPMKPSMEGGKEIWPTEKAGTIFRIKFEGHIPLS